MLIPLPLFAILVLSLCASPLSAQPPPDGLHPAEIAGQRHMEQKPVDWDAAREALAEAARDGSPTAMAHLGWIHEMGHGVRVSHPLAVIWYTRAVESGAGDLALKLGWLHLGGDEAVRDRGLAERWFRHVIDAGNPEGNVALASVLIADALGGKAPERVDEARELLESALDKGLPVAAYFLARIHLEGIGTQRVDHDRALPYVSSGSEYGDPRMQGWLAVMYARGHGVVVDPVESAKWAMLAAAGEDGLGRRLEQHYRAVLSEAELAEARRRALHWASQQPES
jgi:uncharacterized protein